MGCSAMSFLRVAIAAAIHTLNLQIVERLGAPGNESLSIQPLLIATISMPVVALVEILVNGDPQDVDGAGCSSHIFIE